MDTKFNHVPHDPAAYAEPHQSVSGLQLEQDATAARQADHGHINRDTAHGYEAALGKTRETANLMASLHHQTGWTPILVEHDLNYKTGLFGAAHPSRKQAWRDLASKLNDMGPCMLRKAGHMVMLDGIREANGQFHLSIRDPFHGTAVEFRDTAKFFTDQFGTPDRAHIEAVFLKRPT